MTRPAVRVSLEDHRGRQEELKRDSNPFSLVVLAHLKLNEAHTMVERKHWKLALFRQLFALNYSREGRIEMLTFLDWILVLPPELEDAFETEVAELEKGKAMPYLANFERKAMEKGLEQGIEKGREAGLLEAIEAGLELRFGPAGQELLDAVRKLESAEQLRKFHRAIFTAEKVADLKRLVPEA